MTTKVGYSGLDELKVGDPVYYRAGQGDWRVEAKAKISRETGSTGAFIRIDKILYKGSQVELSEGEETLAGVLELYTQVTVEVLHQEWSEVYAVDPYSVRNMTPEELKKHNHSKNRHSPTFRDDEDKLWVKGSHLTSQINRDLVSVGKKQCILATELIGGVP